jgi:hypothetical protein
VRCGLELLVQHCGGQVDRKRVLRERPFAMRRWVELLVHDGGRQVDGFAVLREREPSLRVGVELFVHHVGRSLDRHAVLCVSQAAPNLINEEAKKAANSVSRERLSLTPQARELGAGRRHLGAPSTHQGT